MGYLLSAFHPVVEFDEKRDLSFGREYFEKSDGYVRVHLSED